MCNFGVSEIHVELAFPDEYKNGNITLIVISTLPPTPNWYFPHSLCFCFVLREKTSLGKYSTTLFEGEDTFWTLETLALNLKGMKWSSSDCAGFGRQHRIVTKCSIPELDTVLCFNIFHLLNGEENSAYIRKENLNEITQVKSLEQWLASKWSLNVNCSVVVEICALLQL